MIAVVGAALATLVAGLADEDRVHLRVVRADASACPSDDDLAQRIRERIGSEPFTAAGDDVRELRIGIAKDGGRLVARVVLFAPNGDRLGVRVLHGDPSCVSLTDDVVLAAAIAVDPLLLVRKRPRPPTPTSTPAATPTPATTPATTTTTTTTPADADLITAPMPVLEGPDLAAPATTTVVHETDASFLTPVSVAGRALLLVAGGVGIIATPSLRAQVSFDYGALDLDAGMRFDLPSRYPAGNEGALLDVALLAGDGGVCVGWDYNATLGLRGCGVGEAGVLAAQGIGFDRQAPITAPWLALGGRGALNFRPWPELSFVLEGDALSPLFRARFVDDVTGEVYAEPSVFGWDVGLGVEIQIR